MKDFRIGDYVMVRPDFSNDEFEPFTGQIIEMLIDGKDDRNPIYYIDKDGDANYWMSGNVNKIN